MERERILSELRDVKIFIDRKADQAFQGECAAQTKLSEAQSELMLILLFMKLACSSNAGAWNLIRHIN